MFLDIIKFLHYIYIYRYIYIYIYISQKSNELVLNVLLITNEGKSHYVFIKDFNRLMYSNQKKYK